MIAVPLLLVLALGVLWRHPSVAFEWGPFGSASAVRVAAERTIVSEGDSSIVIPAQSDWMYQGRIVPIGPPGEWDHRIDGSITPSTVLRKDSLLHLYYVGADGDRRTDGGPRHRKLGLATSADGRTWVKHPANPLLEHQTPTSASEESGVFSAGALLREDGAVDVYFGGMEEYVLDLVDGDGVLATSLDGVTFTAEGDVIDHRDSSVFRYGDEIFPVGAFEGDDGTRHVYYVGKGHGGLWDLGLATGPDRDTFESFTEVLDLEGEIKGGGDPIFLSSDAIAVPLLVAGPRSTTIEIRTTSTRTPADLSTVAAVYDFGDVDNVTLYLDRTLRTWYMFYVKPSFDGIHLRTAGPFSVSLVEPKTMNTYVQGSDVRMEADPYELHGKVAGVEFHANGRMLVEDRTAPYSYVMEAVPAGRYSLQAIASDGSGARAASRDLMINVPPLASLDGRVTDGLRFLYRFQEDGGRIVHDMSGIGESLDLTVGDSSAFEWQRASGLSVRSAAVITSPTPASKFVQAVRFSHEMSIESWLEPVDPELGDSTHVLTLGYRQGPRIPGARPSVGAQGSPGLLEIGLRTSDSRTDGSHSRSFDAAGRTEEVNLDSGGRTKIRHVVLTRDASGLEVLYINGKRTAADSVSVDMTSWDPASPLSLTNSADGARPWQGTFHLVAGYSRALTAAEVNRNFEAGPPQRFGDPTADDVVSGRDASAVVRHALGIRRLSGASAQAADVSGDGRIQINDAVGILKRAAGIGTCFEADRSCAE